MKGDKLRCFRIDWLIPVLGIGMVAGFVVAATTYRELERQAHAGEIFMPALDCLSHDLTLSLVLKTLHDGEVDRAAQRLDLLLCWDILRADAELASADAQTRAWTEEMLRRIARVRPKTAEGAADSGGARAPAQQILERALAADHGDRTR